MLKTKAESYRTESIGEQNLTISHRDLYNQEKAGSGEANADAFLENMPDIVCFSHLRWDFVYQRPQHLLSRFAKFGRLFFVEEPVYDGATTPYLQVADRPGGVQVVLPHLPHGLSAPQTEAIQKELLDAFFKEQNLQSYLFWYYTPMAMSFTAQFNPVLTVYDCMDELSAFKFAPARLKELEEQLFKKADLVFTGGQSLYEAKQAQHQQVYAFPSSIDKAHFAQAKQTQEAPADQAQIPHPRIGFFGVIDERMDLDLLAAVATAMPAWHLVIVGPVVKIDPALLPQNENIHYLGSKSYQELPAYVSGWDVAMLPFAINESTKFISPTKTPEYLAAGKPVVSTPIRDVVRPYGDAKLVHIALGPDAFIAATEEALLQAEDAKWQSEVEAFLADMSWDQTWRRMVELMSKALHQNEKKA
ncbi:glycosyltransferase family 1 protein [Pontibacter chitinilyticus]|uniref:glycosyltransferase family 1 protein n=1 Tax=Pontibacter chitinilyticus TaxID=2674989 RepID=UPI0032191014